LVRGCVPVAGDASRGLPSRGLAWLRTGTHKPNVRLSYFTVALFAVLVVSITGCKKSQKPLPAARIHTITREFASAAKSASPPDAQIRTVFRAKDGTDLLEVKFPSQSGAQSPRAESSRILQALNTIAVHAGLTQDAPSGGSEGLQVVYRSAGIPTHTVVLHFAEEAPVQGGPAHGKLAILLDDLGSDRAVADVIFALPYPLTISVLPEHAHSAEIAREATRRGYQVMLHLPMQSLGQEQPEAQELHSGMPAAQVSALVVQFLSAVPAAKGVNNHQGSQATSDPALMAELMPVLRERRLFYVDSRTSAATVAYDAARHDKVPAAFRNVPFLDDVEEKAAIEKQIALALRGAREKGEAIAIGHPHPATLQALREMLPKAKSEGVDLVFVSELVH
jgi:uncharacterized protein